MTTKKEPASLDVDEPCHLGDSNETSAVNEAFKCLQGTSDENEETQEKNQQRLMQLLAENADITQAQNINGETLLMQAVRIKRRQVVELLLRQPNIHESFGLHDKKGQTALLHALRSYDGAVFDELIFFLHSQSAKSLLLKLVPTSNHVSLIMCCINEVPGKDKFVTMEKLLDLGLELGSLSTGLKLSDCRLLVAFIDSINGEETDQQVVLRLANKLIQAHAIFRPPAKRKNGVLHAACSRFLPYLVRFFLDFFKNHSFSYILKKQLEKEGSSRHTPLYLCCYLSNKKSLTSTQQGDLLKCAEHLIEFGARIDYGAIRGATPLFHCLASTRYRRLLEPTDKIAALLIRKGANITRTLTGNNRREIHAAEYAIQNKGLEALRALLELNLVVFEKRLSGPRRIPLDYATDRYIMDCRQYKSGRTKREPTFDMVNLICRYQQDVSQTLFHLSLNQRFAARAKTLRHLLYSGCDVNYCQNHMSILMISFMKRSLSMIKHILLQGPDLSYRHQIKLCRNQPAHRWVCCNQLKAWLKENKIDLRRKHACHMCLQRIKLKHNMISCQKGIDCDCRICEQCFYFQKAVEKSTQKAPPVLGDSVYDISKRGGVQTCQSWARMIYQEEVGRALVDTQAVDAIDPFLHAGLTDFILSARLTSNHLSQIGVLDPVLQTAVLKACRR